jgi:hypothetical protein
MSAIKIHLEDAEYQPVERLAELLHVKPEDVAFAALNQLMLHARDEEIQAEIKRASHWRSNTLPLWADSAGSVHAYEGMPDCEPSQSKYSV